LEHLFFVKLFVQAAMHHKRSQNFVWGALFSSEKLTTFFSRRPWKTVYY